MDNLKDKIKLIHGDGAWRTNAVMGVPAVTVADGPHGLRKQAEDNSGINDSAEATCFPTACAVASSWNRDLAAAVGSSIADEAIIQGVDVVLGPGINIKRSPLCGRNFEYYSEDPYLAGQLASAYVSAMQSKGVGACVKHFAVNSQETRRMTVNAVVDERALREIYLAAFEAVVKNSRPYAIMASYNRVNGQYASQNKRLYDILRNEWDFDGLVMSDWGACYDMGEAFQSGLDLEMPDGGKFHEEMTLNAVKSGKLDESAIDRACSNVANLANKCALKSAVEGDYAEKHRNVAKQVAEQSAVLLKNDDNILPLNTDMRVLVVGELAEQPRYQGAGSSHVNARCDSFIDVLKQHGVKFHYEKGYSVFGDEPNVKLEERAIRNCAEYDVILFFGGLTDDFEGEGYDRDKLDIPNCQQRLLDSLYSYNQNIVFVGFGGSPYCMPWLRECKALLNMYLGGQVVMYAAYDLLFGRTCPSGRLAETFPVSLTDTPCYNYFADDRCADEHRESLFVGYRYYNSYGIKTQFPFGYGLSYTKFEYSNLQVSPVADGCSVSVTVTNLGDISAYEVVQVYVDNCDIGLLRAKRELRAFDKVYVEAGQSVTVQLTLDSRAFEVFYNGRWVKAAGEYAVSVCKDVEHPLLSCKINVDGAIIEGTDRNLYPGYYADVVGSFAINEDEFYRLANCVKQVYAEPKRGQFTLLNTFEDMQSVGLVRTVLKSVRKMAIKKSPSHSLSDPVAKMIYRGAMETPLISLMSVGGVSAKYVMFLLHHANKRHGKAFKALFGKIEL